MNRYEYDAKARKLAEEVEAADQQMERAIRRQMGGELGAASPAPAPSPVSAASGSRPFVARNTADGAGMGRATGDGYAVSSMTWRIICDELADVMHAKLQGKFGMRLSIRGQAVLAEVLQDELLGHAFVVKDERRKTVVLSDGGAK